MPKTTDEVLAELKEVLVSDPGPRQFQMLVAAALLVILERDDDARGDIGQR